MAWPAACQLKDQTAEATTFQPVEPNKTPTLDFSASNITPWTFWKAKEILATGAITCYVRVAPNQSSDADGFPFAARRDSCQVLSGTLRFSLQKQEMP